MIRITGGLRILPHFDRFSTSNTSIFARSRRVSATGISFTRAVRSSLQSCRSRDSNRNFRPPAFARPNLSLAHHRLANAFTLTLSSRHPSRIPGRRFRSITRKGSFATSGLCHSHFSRQALHCSRVPYQTSSYSDKENAAVVCRKSSRTRSQTCCTRGRNRRVVLEPSDCTWNLKLSFPPILSLTSLSFL